MTRTLSLIAALVLAAATLAPAGGPPDFLGGPDFSLGPPGPPPPPHGDGHGKDGPRGDRGKPLSDEEVALAIDTMRRIDPKAAQELDDLRQRDPKEIGTHIRRKFPFVREFLALKGRDPAMFDLRVEDLRHWRESKDLAEGIRDAKVRDDDTKADELTDRLEKLAESHFEVRQQIRQRELEKLEAQLVRLREQLEERADEKDDLIELHVAKLSEGDRSEW